MNPSRRPGRKGMSIASANGLDVYYETHGEGRPLVALHGGLLTFELTYGSVLPQLADGRQVIGVELQGHGHTADIDREFTLADLAADVVGVLDHLGLEQADVIGFSLGGLVALELLTGHPGRVDRAVVCSAHVRHDGYRPEIFDPAMTSPLLPTPADFEQMTKAHAAVSPTPDRFGEVGRKTQGAINPLPGWSDEQLGGITAPTLVVIGDRDFVRLEHAVLMHELIPGSQLAVLPDTTHQGVTQTPELLGPVVNRFLTR
jgi:pimeloyl-ACP methyl ester carboxylesterase